MKTCGDDGCCNCRMAGAATSGGGSDLALFAGALGLGLALRRRRRGAEPR